MTSAERAFAAPRGSAPLCLFSSTSVAIGANANANADDFQNHFDCPILIEEIRFILYANSQVGLPSIGGHVRVQIKVGRIDLTNGLVPIFLLGPRLSQAASMYNAGAGGSANYEFHKWKLPVPMPVPAGATLSLTYQYILPNGTTVLSDATASPITVFAAAIGRSLDRSIRLPGKIRVPYVTAFIPNTAGGQQSGDDQLVNKFNVPLHVQRFNARWLSQGAGNPEIWVEDEGLRSSISATNGGITIRDSAGYQIVGTMTPWQDVFGRVRKMLPVNQVLGPREWYVVTFENKPTVGVSPFFWPMISIVGWREEELVP